MKAEVELSDFILVAGGKNLVANSWDSLLGGVYTMAYEIVVDNFILKHIFTFKVWIYNASL